MKSFSRNKAQVPIMQGREGRRGGEEERKSWELKQGSCELGALTLHSRVLHAIKHFPSPIKLCQRSLTQPIRCYLDAHCVYCACGLRTGIWSGCWGEWRASVCQPYHTDSSIPPHVQSIQVIALK